LKLREWEIRKHLTDLLGEESDVFGISDNFTLRIWIVRPGFSIHNNGARIAIAIDGLTGKYFDPDLSKINRASLELADRVAGVPNYDYDSDYGNPDAVEKLFS
jgi:hypothetical protein